MAEMAVFSKAKTAIFRVLSPVFLNASDRLDCLYVGRPFWQPRPEKMAGGQ
jgi:hypothetical protein